MRSYINTGEYDNGTQHVLLSFLSLSFLTTGVVPQVRDTQYTRFFVCAGENFERPRQTLPVSQPSTQNMVCPASARRRRREERRNKDRPLPSNARQRRPPRQIRRSEFTPDVESTKDVCLGVRSGDHIRGRYVCIRRYGRVTGAQVLGKGCVIAPVVLFNRRQHARDCPALRPSPFPSFTKRTYLPNVRG